MPSTTIFEQLLQKTTANVKFQSHRHVVKSMKKEHKLVATYLPSTGWIKIVRHEQNIACNYLTISTTRIEQHLKAAAGDETSSHTQWQTLEAEVIRLLSYGKNRNYHLNERGLFEAV